MKTPWLNGGSKRIMTSQHHRKDIVTTSRRCRDVDAIHRDVPLFKRNAAKNKNWRRKMKIKNTIYSNKMKQSKRFHFRFRFHLDLSLWLQHCNSKTITVGALITESTDLKRNICLRVTLNQENKNEHQKTTTKQKREMKTIRKTTIGFASGGRRAFLSVFVRLELFFSNFGSSY